MSVITDALSVALDTLQADQSTSARLSATSDFIRQLEALTEGDEAPDDAYSEWQMATRAGLKSKNTALVKYGKTLAPLDDLQLTDAYLYPVDKEKHALAIENAIKLHLIRDGQVSVLKDEIDGELLSKFQEMSGIERDILTGELGSAIGWCERHDAQDLLFQLHQIKFRSLLESPHMALAYGQKHLSRFNDDTTLPTLMKLAAMLLYPPPPPPSKTELHALSMAFAATFSSTIGIPPQSALSTVSLAAHLAMPTLLKFSQLQRQKNLNWSSTDELPFEAHLPRELHFHPVFICPVSKEETANGDARAMPCGHIISKQSMEMLAGGSRMSSARVSSSAGSRLKCPYCPNVCSVKDCKPCAFYLL